MTTLVATHHIIEEARASGLNAHVRRPMLSYRRVGGLHFISVWRFGASFYIRRRA